MSTKAMTNPLHILLQNAEIIEEGVTKFLEAVPPLITALDEVAKVYPFIKGASSFYHTGLR